MTARAFSFLPGTGAKVTFDRGLPSYRTGGRGAYPQGKIGACLPSMALRAPNTSRMDGRLFPGPLLFLCCWRISAADTTQAGLEQVLPARRSEEHTSELQSQSNLVCRLLLEKKKSMAIGTALLDITRLSQSPHTTAPT